MPDERSTTLLEDEIETTGGVAPKAAADDDSTDADDADDADSSDADDADGSDA